MTVLVNNPKISWTIIVRKMGDSLFGILRSIKQVYQVNGGRGIDGKPAFPSARRISWKVASAGRQALKRLEKTKYNNNKKTKKNASGIGNTDL